ncbi:hypothetical protein [Arthrobacter sp. ISL-69]|uniref:hypothetical protein n=1 Tax=Arthrobacter sp. ISL-69 TaxID=2819113 RepID=UPI001BE5C2D2|nr:hypothetical protein [Arthrobacter sp. ISL-69]MBT2539005.1 hypothetical protein [Arthrobacter sp. ISL-69]
MRLLLPRTGSHHFSSTGIPGAVRIVPGNTAGPSASTGIAGEIKDLSGVEEMVMVGDWA